MPLRHSLLAVLVMLVWGGNFVAIDVGVAEVPPLLFVAIRFVLVAFPLVLFVPRPRGRMREVVAIGAFMSLGQFTLLYLALALGLPSGLASLLLQAQVVLTMALAALALGERPTRRQGVGALVGSAGLLVVASARGSADAVLPVVVILGAALSWAVGNVVSRRAGISGGLSVVVWSALVVPVPALALSLLVDGPAQVGSALSGFSTTAAVSTAYTVYGASLLGYGIWNSLLARHPAGAVVPFVLLVPPVGLTCGWVFLGERPSPVELAGAAVALVGVGLATVTARRRAPRPPVDARPRPVGAATG
ncbi:EamA family transporter [Nocardioides aestuarii]|uniref:EamA family transporter n=1 Tax=Nocardioides aestuarii TaxID=252231 RepID=A0ABW4TSA4_9ACTN